MKVLSVANVGLGVVKAFFPGIPTIPEGAMKKGRALLEGLAQKSSGEQFGCIAGALEGIKSDKVQHQVGQGPGWRSAGFMDGGGWTRRVQREEAVLGHCARAAYSARAVPGLLTVLQS